MTRRGEAGTGETAASLPRYRELLDPRDRCVTMSLDASYQEHEVWFLAPTGAQGMLMSVCLSVPSLSRALNLHLSDSDLFSSGHLGCQNSLPT